MTPRPWTLPILLAQIAFGMLAMALCLPSMPAWVDAFGVGTAQVQLTFAAYVAAFGWMQLFYGPWSDRHGRRPVLLAGLALAAAGSLLAALASDVGTLMLARGLQGAGTAAGVVVGRALVQDLYTGTDRTRIMAYVGMAMGVSPPLGTLLGGQLHDRFGWASTFWLATMLALLLWGAVWWGLPRTASSASGAVAGWKDMWHGYARLARLPVFRWHVALLGFTYATLYAFLSGAPVVLAAQGVGAAEVGWFVLCMTASYILGSFLTSRWIRRTSGYTLMSLGQWITLAGVALMLALAWWKAPVIWSMTLPLMLVGLGHGLLVPPTLAGTVGQLPALAGSAAAVAGLAQQFMGAAGSFSLGLFETPGVPTLAGLMLLYTLCAMGAQTRLFSRAPPPHPTPRT